LSTGAILAARREKVSGVKTKAQSIHRGRTAVARNKSIVKAKRVKLADKFSASKTVSGKPRIKKIATGNPWLKAKLKGRRTAAADSAGSVGEHDALKTLAGLRGLDNLAAAIEQAQTVGRSVRFTVDVTPKGRAAISAVDPIAADTESLSNSRARFGRGLDRSLTTARERGRKRVAEILSGKDMLSADKMARLLGTTRTTINTKRRNHQLLGLEGATRGFRFPQWQIGEDGKPFEALLALFDRLGGSPWAVYRFLVQHHAELGGLTGREALAKGRSADVIESAESMAEAFS
jgi:hypothetical protein